MPTWIFVCCRKPLGAIPASRLLAGITDRDGEAPAGIDYLTLAEQYPVGNGRDCAHVGEMVAQALASLRVSEISGPGNLSHELRYAPWPARPVSLHRWTLPVEGGEILAALIKPDEVVAGARASDFVELVGIRMWGHHIIDMGLVFGYEIARYLCQLGRALILNDEGEWTELAEGSWRHTGTHLAQHPMTGRPTVDELVAEAHAAPEPVRWLLEQARNVFFAFGRSRVDPASLLASLYEVGDPPRGRALTELLEHLVDDAMVQGGHNSFFAPPAAMRRLHQLIAAAPSGMAETLIAPPTGVRWRFAVDQPTPYVIDRAVGEVASWPRITSVFNHGNAIEVLPRFGTGATRPLIQALEERRPQRLILLASLATIGSPEGLPVLLSHLGDPLDRVRSVAAWGLEVLGPQIARAQVEAATRSKSRGARDSAKQVLHAWDSPEHSGPTPVDRWCEGCGIVMQDFPFPCLWCAHQLQPVPPSPWRALARRPCPVDLSMKR